MPKYIRTKDTIFEVLEDYKNSWLVRAKRNNKKNYPKCKKNSFFVKQADTIEELCDEFVLVNSKIWVLGGYNKWETKHDAEWDYKNAIRLWKISKVSNKALYGAIWTDKGLIYVAKMNEKGDLELL